jgi:hypothetical protein
MDVVQRLPPVGRSHQNELFLLDQLDPEARQHLGRVQHRKIERARPQLFQQLVGYADMGVDRYLRLLALHPHQPVQQQRVPQAEFAAERHDAGAAGRDGELLARTLPDLHHGLRETFELAAGGSQRGTIAVAHEQLPAEFLLQRADSCAHRRLGDMQAIRSFQETAGMNDLQKSPGTVYVHGAPP